MQLQLPATATAAATASTSLSSRELARAGELVRAAVGRGLRARVVLLAAWRAEGEDRDVNMNQRALEDAVQVANNKSTTDVRVYL